MQCLYQRFVICEHLEWAAFQFVPTLPDRKPFLAKLNAPRLCGYERRETIVECLQEPVVFF